MANFCYDCTKDILGVDPKWNDFASPPSFGHGNWDWEKEKKKLYKVLCEGCGVIVVDYEGKKVDDILLSFSERIDEDEN